MADSVLIVKVIPRSSQRKVEMQADGSLKVWVSQAPTDGQANEGVTKAIADKLGIAPSKVQIIKGETSRTKSVKVLDLEPEELLRRVRNEQQ